MTSPLAQNTADHLRRQGARIVIAILRTVANDSRGEWCEGKVQLGRAAGACGANGTAARPVETAVRLGLILELRVRKDPAFHYQMTDLGREVLRLLDTQEGDDA